MSHSFFYPSAISLCSLCSLSFLPSPATFSPPFTLPTINFCPNVILFHPLKSVWEASCHFFMDTGIWNTLLWCGMGWPFLLRRCGHSWPDSWFTCDEPCRSLHALKDPWHWKIFKTFLYRRGWVGWTVLWCRMIVILFPFLDLWDFLLHLSFMIRILNYPGFCLCNYKVL